MNPENTIQKPKSNKWKFKLVAVLILIGLVVYIYFWFANMISENKKAELVLADAKYAETLKSTISSEVSRCQDFIIQKQGDFSSFEYCKKFIDWASVNDLISK